MCGIAGILGPTRDGDADRIAAMNAIQSHRGPNAARFHTEEGAALGHVRLSVIDLTDRALQPMESVSGRYLLVYNGEIYNYKELRETLRNSHVFTTSSDTEVLLAAFEKWGEDCLDRLNGMFAFCIYDRTEGSAFMARDRFGQKPFHFAERDGRLYFASEIKAILAAGIAAEPEHSTWARYLVQASYDDNEFTFFKNIFQLRPGECASWRRGGSISRRQYYRLEDSGNPEAVDARDAAEHVRELLLDAVRIHMRADVPVGVALSGGLDSSTLLACIDTAGELHDGVQCISVDFGGDLSEERWIRGAAEHHGLESRILSFSPEEFRSSMAPLMWQLEGPLGGLMNNALSVVMAEARNAGITVVQDGTGLDEAFAGYRNHHNLYIGTLLHRNDPAAESALKVYAGNWGVDVETARAAALAEISQAGTAIDGTIPVRPNLLDPAFVTANSAESYRHDTSGNPLRDALIDYLQARKIPRNTRFKDRLSMAYGLELRLPFLDHRLVEYALSLPPEHYFIEGRSKSIVREALAGIMDDDVRLAPKRSVQAPQGPWLMKEPMKSYVRDLIGSASFAGRGIFDPAKCQSAFDEFLERHYSNSFFVWQWINTEEWFRTFVDRDAVRDRQPACPDLARKVGLWTKDAAVRNRA